MIKWFKKQTFGIKFSLVSAVVIGCLMFLCVGCTILALFVVPYSEPTLSLTYDTPTTKSSVTIVGSTSSNASKVILYSNNGKKLDEVKPDSGGDFMFTKVKLDKGDNAFKVKAFTEKGNSTEKSVLIVLNEAKKKPAEDKQKEEVKETKQEPQPISLSGASQQASDKFVLESGLSIFKMTHDGSSNFAITLLDENGQRVELLVNEIGPFNGSKAVGITMSGTHILDIAADGAWTITIEQPRPSDAPATTNFTGNTQQATSLFSLSKGLKTFEMSHNGNSNFAPLLMDEKGQYIELLANEIGQFNGSKAIGIPKTGIYILDVTASGDWTINVK